MSVSTGYRHLIGGEWVDAADGGTMEVLNPSTGETIAEVPRGTAEDVDRAVDAAERAWPEWRDVTPAERAELLLKLADVIDENADELARLESQNGGKPLPYAVDEMPVCSDNLRFFAGAARVLEGRSAGESMKGYTSWVRREPIAPTYATSGSRRATSSRGTSNLGSWVRTHTTVRRSMCPASTSASR